MEREFDYSIVIPVYYNEGLLKATCAAIQSEVVEKNPGLRGEIIFVDDGSGDGSFEELMELYAAYPELVKVIKLTRNFGQVNALQAGFRQARGKCAVAMSADGQDPAELITAMLAGYFQEGYEVVLCARAGRDESGYRRVTSRIFYGMMRRLSFPGIPAGGFDFVLLGRQALQSYLEQREAHPFFQGQILYMGYKTKVIPYQRLQRKSGRSRWTFGKKLTYLLDGVLNYSFFPIRLMSVIGLLSATLGFLYAMIVLVSKLAWGNPVQGWTPLMIVVLVMGGVQMAMLGLIGEYLWRTFAQVQNRPGYYIEAIYEHGAGEGRVD